MYGQSAVKRARTLGTVGTVIGGVGLAATGLGIYLHIRASKRERLTVTPVGTSSSIGIAALGSF